MNADARPGALTRHRTAVAGVTAALVVLLVVLLWPEAAKPPGAGRAPMDPDSDALTDHSGHGAMQSPDPHAGHTDPLTQSTELWSCSMHPHITSDGPGQCPICGMALTPVRKDPSASGTAARQLTITAAQRALMKIETVPVERRFPTVELRLAGTVTYDETRLAHISAWVPGRIEELLADYTGVTVRKGDHMVRLYSPELLSAQEELLQARRGLRELSQTSSGALRRSIQATLDSARDKLRLWGLSAEQIAAVERSGVAEEQVTIFSPASGVVIELHVQEGMYVETGTRIFTIADLGALWVQLDAYESDLRWLRYGQRVSFTTEALPGETFTGVVSFIPPTIDPRTRTTKVRINVSNPDGRLKPQMFVRATVLAQFAGGGRMLDPALTGKWVSPMHPEIVKDAPGRCDICGMALVPAESLGYTSSADAVAPLVIPATAALLTGTRAVVYVEDYANGRPTYLGREVVLGPRAGPDYVVESGLEEGDLVVVSGNFKIDSALQIQARPSMMNPSGGASSSGGHDHGSR